MFSQPLILGSTYRLKFKSIFERHGVCTTPGVTCLHPGGGVFRLEQITNFRDVVLAGIKLYDVFFKPLGISEEEYSKYFDGKPADEFEPEYGTKLVENETTDTETTTRDGKLVVLTKKVITTHEVHVETGKSRIKKHYKDNVSYATYPVYKFVDAVDTSDVIYVPELTLAEFPEIDIAEYKDLSLVVHLGYLDDPARIDPMLLSIRERMAAYGWRPDLVRLYCTDTKWMNPMEYEAVKKMRVPAKTVMIKDDTVSKYLGETAIVNGQFKKLAKNVTSATADTEIDIDEVKLHPQVIDNRLFITPCEDSDVFVAGDTYYLQFTETTDSGTMKVMKILKEGYDYSPGEPCIAHIPVSYEDAIGKHAGKVYVKSPASYTKVEYGKHAEYSASSLLRKLIGTVYKETLDTSRNTSKHYYLYEGELEYREASNEDFVHRDGDADGVNTGFDLSKMYLEIYASGQEVYRQATEDEVNDPSQVLYFKNPDNYVSTTDVHEGGEYYVRSVDVADNVSGDAVVYKEMYATEEALVLQGFKFSYQDLFKYTQNLTLQLEDIIDIGLSENTTTLPDASLEYDEYWKEYDGRRFRWQENVDGDPTQTVSLEILITKDTYRRVSQKTGMLLGQSGQIGKEIYIKDSDSLKRNYYMKYMTQLKTVEDQKTRIAELEKLVLELIENQS
jgi:hypothetical protein